MFDRDAWVTSLERLFETPEPFRQWLIRRLPDGVVGEPRNSTGCPLFWFIRDNVCECWVHPETVVHPCGERWFLPPWATIFQVLVDIGPDRPVTARRALRLLERAVKKVYQD
ncbi:MAG: hypothetical protein C4291_15770 [Candidatus Dadabacteria bacterium]